MIWLGVDSFVAGLMTGTLRLSRRFRLGWIVLCGLCDGAAAGLGAGVSHRLPDLPDALLYAAAALLVAWAARTSRFWLLAIPFAMSLDNLAAGAPAADAPALGVTSALMAATGMALGGIAHMALRRARRVAA